jgi:hypothetical protein
MGYGWSGRLRPSPTPIVPRLPCYPNLLRHRFARLSRQRPREGSRHLRPIIDKHMLTRALRPQWISEVLHFCQGLPIILGGCKKDLRYDPKTIEELRKTSQKPVSPEEVPPSPFPHLVAYAQAPAPSNKGLSHGHECTEYNANVDMFRARRCAKRLVPTSISNVRPRPTRESARYSNTLPAPPFSPEAARSVTSPSA